MKYPRLWQHKKNKSQVRVMPWWETVKDGEIEEVDELGQLMTEVAGRPAKFGTIVQIGYLLENFDGVWIGVGLMAKKQFKDKGEWKSQRDNEPKK